MIERIERWLENWLWKRRQSLDIYERGVRIEAPGPTPNELQFYINGKSFDPPITDLTIYMKAGELNRLELGMLCGGLDLLTGFGGLDVTVRHVPGLCQHEDNE
jgi:hypothetical protein